MTFEMMFLLGLILFLGFIASRISLLSKIPRVSTYVLIGMLLSPSVLGIIDKSFLAQSDFIVHTVLGIIAFIVGGSIKIHEIRENGSKMLIILIFQTIVTFLIVGTGLILLLPYLLPDLESEQVVLVTSLLLAALSVTTAPGATLAIIHEYKAKGSLTSALLSMVALDDILGIMIFSWVTALVLFAISLAAFEVWQLIEPIIFITLSLGVGVIVGGILIYLLTHSKHLHTFIIITFSVVTMSYALAVEYHLEPLLVTVVAGFIASNFSKVYKLVELDIKMHFEELFFVPFFILAGAHFELDSFEKVWPIALVYVVLRILGKFIGSYFGAKVVKSPDTVRRFLGWGLIPQAGVVIGLSLLLEQYESLDAYAPLLLSVIITSVAINELVGPLLTRYVLLASGEAKEGKLSKRKDN